MQFGSNPDNGWVEEHIIVLKGKDMNNEPTTRAFLIGAYATDRLRYSVKLEKGKPNDAPAVEPLRKIDADGVKIVGPSAILCGFYVPTGPYWKAKRVTCAHNIICDVENAGADVQYGDDGTVGSVIDGDLITAKHPAFTDELIDLYIKEIEA